MIEAVVFDVDGTLVDSVDLHARAWQDAFSDFGHEIGFGEIRGQIGKGGDQLMPVFLSPEEMEAKGEALSKHRARLMQERYLPEIRPFPGVPALFRRLREDGVRIALASSAKADELQEYKRIAGIEDLVDVETSSDDAERSKPFPDIFRAALSRLKGVAPAAAIAIGDTPYDAEAAAGAGLRTIGVLCGGFPESDLRRAGCVAIFEGPADLLARFDASPLARKAPAG
ncbi:HAD family hydrolase [Muricoccus nepalensis]|uniref:HAD family hydrolase n=1 Tax=Muricoccus nepalensis TaxID=1854500 RepID=UPI001884377F|nr:HAD family hydrolase [Roseomonas nepalensis]